MSVKLLTDHHLEFLSLKGGYKSSSVSIHVIMPHCWKSHVVANIVAFTRCYHEVSPQNENKNRIHLSYCNFGTYIVFSNSEGSNHMRGSRKFCQAFFLLMRGGMIKVPL